MVGDEGAERGQICSGHLGGMRIDPFKDVATEGNGTTAGIAVLFRGKVGVVFEGACEGGEEGASEGEGHQIGGGGCSRG